MLRTSTRVSSGFILARHSSPSFGSQHVCSWYLPTARALGHPGQSRIGRRHRTLWRTRAGPQKEDTAQSPPPARHTQREPKQSQSGQQQICAQASNGKSRACAPLRAGGRPLFTACRTSGRSLTHAAHEAGAGAGERDSPRANYAPSATSLRGRAAETAKAVGDRPRRPPHK